MVLKISESEHAVRAKRFYVFLSPGVKHDTINTEARNSYLTLNPTYATLAAILTKTVCQQITE